MNPLFDPTYYTEGRNNLPFLGSIISAGASILGARSQNKAAAKEAERSRLFTKEQLQNRHQWEVADLRKAGLNPVLSARSGAPIGGSAMAAVPANMADGVNSAIAVARMKEDLKLIRAQTQKTRTETRGIASLNEAKKNIATIAETVDPILKDASNSAKAVYNETKKVAKQGKKAMTSQKSPGAAVARTRKKLWNKFKKWRNR